MEINTLIKQLPDLLQASVTTQLESFVDSDIDLSSIPDEIAESLVKVWACSDFAMQTCVRFPQLFLELASSGDLLKRYDDNFYHDLVFLKY